MNTYYSRISHFTNDKGERVPSHRYRRIRDGICVEPAQDLKDDPEVIRILNALDMLERESRPSLCKDARIKRVAAANAIAFAGALVDYVAGWAIDHERGLAQRACGEREVHQERHALPMKLPQERPDEDHRDEMVGAFRRPLGPAETRKFLLSVLRQMAPALVLSDVVESIEALGFGETLPIFQRAPSSKRTGLIQYRARLKALTFIEYESKKGIKKGFSVEKVADAFAVTRDAVKDWRADLRGALGKYEVDTAIELARQFGRFYVYFEKRKDKSGCEFLDQEYGRPALLKEAERYKARSKKRDR